jgi:hypothetical protein
MSLLDSLCKLSDGQAPTTNNTSYSSYTYDFGNVTPKRDIGNGEPMCVLFSIGVAAAVSADTITFDVVSCTSATDVSAGLKVLGSRTIAGATLAVNTQHVVSIAPGSVDQRYIGIRYVLGSGDSVTLDADLIPQSMVGLYKSYADAVTWS